MTDLETKLLGLLCINAYEVYLASLHGCSTPVREDLRDFCIDVQPGDLVMERSTIWNRERDSHRFGKLLRIEDRPRWTPEEWADQGGRPDETIPVERYWIIERVDGGGEYAWYNADFFRVTDTLLGSGEFKSRKRRAR